MLSYPTYINPTDCPLARPPRYGPLVVLVLLYVKHNQTHTSTRAGAGAHMHVNKHTCTRTRVPSCAAGSTTSEGDDVATLMTAPWRGMRRAVLKRNTVPELAFRQYLFAAQVCGVHVCMLRAHAPH